MARKLFKIPGNGGRFEVLDEATLVAGEIEVGVPMTSVFAVYFSQNTATPVEEFFGWEFDRATQKLTITSSEVTSTATVTYHAIGY
jgi:hypothetical protein